MEGKEREGGVRVHAAAALLHRRESLGGRPGGGEAAGQAVALQEQDLQGWPVAGAAPEGRQHPGQLVATQ